VLDIAADEHGNDARRGVGNRHAVPEVVQSTLTA
jgi:hypothetical protein